MKVLVTGGLGFIGSNLLASVRIFKMILLKSLQDRNSHLLMEFRV